MAMINGVYEYFFVVSQQDSVIGNMLQSKVSLFPLGDIPNANQFFHKIINVLLILGKKFFRTTAFDVIFKQLIVDAFEQSNRCIHLLSDVGTILILLDHGLKFFEDAERFFDAKLDSFLVFEKHEEIVKN